VRDQDAIENRAHSQFSRAASQGRLDERLKLYTVPRLLIVDLW